MPFKAIAFSAHQHLENATGQRFRRSHIYELIAAALGERSHAALVSCGYLTDASIGPSFPAITPMLMERLARLGYASTVANDAAAAVVELGSRLHLGFVRTERLLELSSPKSGVHAPCDDDWEDDLCDPDNEDIESLSADDAPHVSDPLTLESLRTSPLLMASLSQAAAVGRVDAHFVLAALYRCSKPNRYLYDEALKGRVLNSAEQRWVAAYPAEQEQFDRYARHLHLAATHGSRHACLEYADVFNEPSFYRMAEDGSGPVDAWRMYELAITSQQRERWLREAAEQGLWDALETLGFGHESGPAETRVWALRKMAEAGDLEAIRESARLAIGSGRLVDAWLWQHLALMLGKDLTRSTMRAYHDGGHYAGLDYDDEYGGPLYVDGDEGLNMPAIDSEADLRAKDEAQRLFEGLVLRD